MGKKNLIEQNNRTDRGMAGRPEINETRFRDNKSIVLFLIGSFSLGLSQAFSMLFLNFYIKALGLDQSWQGIINAIPAITAAIISLPAVVLAKRISESNTIKIGSFCTFLGTITIIFANSALVVILGSLILGIGNAMMMVSNAPYIASQTEASARVKLFSLNMALVTGAGFLGNMVGGRIPEYYASLHNLDPKGLLPLRAALITASGIQLLGFLAILFLKRNRERNQGEVLGLTSIRVNDVKTMTKMVVPNIVVGLGAGFTIPFLNIFIENKFQISYSELGTYFGWTSLATALTVLIQPWLVRKMGQINAILLVQVLSLPFLIILGFSPYLFLVIIAMFTRGALMNAGSPVYTSLAMDKLNEDDRPMYSALNLIGWNSSWALASTLSGFIRKFYGQENILRAFSLLFILTMIAYSLSTYLIYRWIKQGK